jgi:hypothetical protein
MPPLAGCAVAPGGVVSGRIEPQAMLALERDDVAAIRPRGQAFGIVEASCDRPAARVDERAETRALQSGQASRRIDNESCVEPVAAVGDHRHTPTVVGDPQVGPPAEARLQRGKP